MTKGSRDMTRFPQHVMENAKKRLIFAAILRHLGRNLAMVENCIFNIKTRYNYMNDNNYQVRVLQLIKNTWHKRINYWRSQTITGRHSTQSTRSLFVHKLHKI